MSYVYNRISFPQEHNYAISITDKSLFQLLKKDGIQTYFLSSFKLWILTFRWEVLWLAAIFMWLQYYYLILEYAEETTFGNHSRKLWHKTWCKLAKPSINQKRFIATKMIGASKHIHTFAANDISAIR